jgi:hypothetical protein
VRWAIRRLSRLEVGRPGTESRHSDGNSGLVSIPAKVKVGGEPVPGGGIKMDPSYEDSTAFSFLIIKFGPKDGSPCVTYSGVRGARLAAGPAPQAPSRNPLTDPGPSARRRGVSFPSVEGGGRRRSDSVCGVSTEMGREVAPHALASEERLEDIVHKRPEILGLGDLLLIGRQVITD